MNCKTNWASPIRSPTVASPAGFWSDGWGPLATVCPWLTFKFEEINKIKNPKIKLEKATGFVLVGLRVGATKETESARGRENGGALTVGWNYHSIPPENFVYKI